jgi:hypothetical protein
MFLVQALVSTVVGGCGSRRSGGGGGGIGGGFRLRVEEEERKGRKRKSSRRRERRGVNELRPVKRDQNDRKRRREVVRNRTLVFALLTPPVFVGSGSRPA